MIQVRMHFIIHHSRLCPSFPLEHRLYPRCSHRSWLLMRHPNQARNVYTSQVPRFPRRHRHMRCRTYHLNVLSLFDLGTTIRLLNLPQIDRPRACPLEAQQSRPLPYGSSFSVLSVLVKTTGHTSIAYQTALEKSACTIGMHLVRIDRLHIAGWRLNQKLHDTLHQVSLG